MNGTVYRVPRVGAMIFVVITTTLLFGATVVILQVRHSLEDFKTATYKACLARNKQIDDIAEVWRRQIQIEESNRFVDETIRKQRIAAYQIGLSAGDTKLVCAELK